MVSFQCSRHATARGIVGVFDLCYKYQEKRDRNKFVAVVVLDEVGLAEDSENMPLKVCFSLHPYYVGTSSYIPCLMSHSAKPPT